MLCGTDLDTDRFAEDFIALGEAIQSGDALVTDVEVGERARVETANERTMNVTFVPSTEAVDILNGLPHRWGDDTEGGDA